MGTLPTGGRRPVTDRPLGALPGVALGSDSPGELRVVPPARLVIVEGVSATRREVRLPWAMTVWVDAPAEVRLQRARDRDGEAMLSVWLERWIPSEEAYVEREHPQQRVDLVVSGC